MGLFSKRSASAGSTRAEPATTADAVGELTDVERDWITSLLAIVGEAGTDLDDARQVQLLYDDSAARWRRVNPPERVDPEPMINAIGTALGEHLARRMPLRWALVTIGGRAELGLVDGAGRLTLAPTVLVGAEWHAEHGGEFVRETVDRLAERFARSGGRRPS